MSGPAVTGAHHSFGTLEAPAWQQQSEQAMIGFSNQDTTGGWCYARMPVLVPQNTNHQQSCGSGGSDAAAVAAWQQAPLGSSFDVEASRAFHAPLAVAPLQSAACGGAQTAAWQPQAPTVYSGKSDSFGAVPAISDNSLAADTGWWRHPLADSSAHSWHSAETGQLQGRMIIATSPDAGVAAAKGARRQLSGATGYSFDRSKLLGHSFDQRRDTASAPSTPPMQAKAAGQVALVKLSDLVPETSTQSLQSETPSLTQAKRSRQRTRRRLTKEGKEPASAEPDKAAGLLVVNDDTPTTDTIPRRPFEPHCENCVVFDGETGQELIEQLAEDGRARCTAMKAIRGSVPGLSFEAVGCRVVQQALQVGDTGEKEALVAELAGHVRSAMRSPHANFVIQKVIELVPSSLAEFVAEELTGTAPEVARHRYGCRIMCRLLEHPNAKSAPLTEEILADARHLCHHAFGHHVIDSVIEHGTVSERSRISTVLRANLLQNSRNRYASYVVERAMNLCSPQVKYTFVAEFLNKSDNLLALGAHEYGSHVLRTLLRLPSENVEKVRGILLAGADRLRMSKYGRKLLDEL